MANVAVKPAQAAIRADGAASAHTTISSAAIDRPPLFTEIQSRAREWADKAIDLHQAGCARQAREAERQAEIWLARMREAEATFRNARSPVATGKRRLA